MTAAEFDAPEVGGLPDLDLDPDLFPGEVAHAGMVAAFRADNHADWRRYRWLLSACRSRAGTTMRRADDPRAAQAAAAAFGWSSAMASARYDFAHEILERLPAIGEAMREGRLEERKAAILVSTVRELDDAQARLVVDRVLGRAPELTHRALTDLTEKNAADVDPDWEEARRRAAEARARVLARMAPSGAAELSGLDLPVEPALEAHGHLVAVADAVHAAIEARGRDLTLGVVQAHVFLRLLQHDLLGADDAMIVETLTDELAPLPPDDGDRPDGGPDDTRPDDDHPDGGPDHDGPDDEEPEDAADLHDCGPDAHEPDDDHAPCGPHAHRRRPEDRPSLAYRAGVAIRLGLTTLLDHDPRPGEIPRWGVVSARTARKTARGRADATWRVILYEPDGRFDQVLTTRPPGDGSVPGEPHRREVVELVATAAMIDALHPADHLGFDAELVRRAKKALYAARTRPPEDHPAVSHADAHRRHPGARLDRHVRARDRCCRFPGCSRPAMGADLDHTLDWLYGGLSLAANLGALCRFHHRLKHDPDSGWSVTQPSPGRFEWISPQGARHIVEPTAEPELRDPLPPAGGGFSLPAAVFGFGPPPRATEPWAPRRNRHGHLTDEARASADEVDRILRGAVDLPPSRYDDDPDF